MEETMNINLSGAWTVTQGDEGILINVLLGTGTEVTRAVAFRLFNPYLHFCDWDLLHSGN